MDLRLLLGLIRKHKPGATAGWETVGCAYNKYATAAERKLREPNALRVKFEKLCKAAKSTDDTDCSWDVTEIIEHFAIPDTEQGYESEGDPEVEAMPVAKRGRVTYRASPAASEVHDALDPSDVHHRGAVPDMLANWSTAMMLRLEIADLREELRDSERRAYELQSQLNTARMQLIMSGFWEQIESRQALVAEVEHEPRHRRHLSRH
ncbi:hypothetical protein BOTBODRAFT_185162 [Botryobasidium botryosum FD-172 SS1]|uniref:Uncharacterized protein n=1 Tax=Botryobasidium botryosum (strain FD-172 SS1) TaxID=930990 RepID=A0A067N391_BOTB1|nr:hypothetical protein BOTBODRAFT_185162 [Botryobasidium botryosum FD-172 SS1]